MNRELADALDKLKAVQYASPDWMHYDSIRNLLEQVLYGIRKAIENPTINYPIINDVIWTLEQARVFLLPEKPPEDGASHGQAA